MIRFVGEGVLSEKARGLVDFDMASIRQTISAVRGQEPALWLVSMPQYEANGRLLRDSTSPRLVAYTPGDLRVYATDGCNSCAKALSVDLAAMDGEAVQKVSYESGIEKPLLEQLISYARESRDK